MGMKRLIAVAGVALATLVACEPSPLPTPPPFTLPPLPVIVPISQCKDVFPDGYTRPVPTGKPIFFLPALAGVRKIMWLDRHCDKWWIGPYDPAHPLTACAYRPDLGDRYYADPDQAMFVAPAPQACPQGA
jgi:hypothetical protein